MSYIRSSKSTTKLGAPQNVNILFSRSNLLIAEARQVERIAQIKDESKFRAAFLSMYCRNAISETRSSKTLDTKRVYQNATLFLVKTINDTCLND